jgi:hypothetical protein
MRLLVGFDQTPGALGVALPRWPMSTAIHRNPDLQQMLVFLHPFCPCSAATLAELARVPARRPRDIPQPEIKILFVRPRGATEWRAGRLWDTAQKLPGAEVMWDEGGEEADRFGAQTSGAVFLYNSGGSLLFHGGVTGSRGHAGDNYGADQLILALNSGRPVSGKHLVFGCALTAPIGVAQP